MFRLRIIPLFLCIVITIAAQTGFPVFAEQSPTVNECLQHPDLCEQQTDSHKKVTSTQKEQGSPLSVWDVIKLIGATVFVLLLIYGLLKFLHHRGQLFTGKKGVIEHLGGTSVGTNRSVQLIKVGNRILVIGVGESIQLLREIDDEKEIEEILALHHERLQQMLEPSKWGARLHNYLTEKRKQTSDRHDSFRDMFLKEMQELSVKRKELLKQVKRKGTTSDE
ncbi:flagella biosynthesis regulatory protein FliZ [Parageobacillus toebii]|uniref:flagella biosynthesis regulatory protein FliZ n=1 Tax=Parageobacillus toebii TaxID=153151 RepID=UPI001967B3CB|nr:flagella biosynthesis regulatory protein FliZ [Parageobacillus toebii]QSB48203.1 flagella biosynthesis regulatory protein FliZ [Parageobacillus toebii]